MCVYMHTTLYIVLYLKPLSIANAKAADNKTHTYIGEPTERACGCRIPLESCKCKAKKAGGKGVRYIVVVICGFPCAIIIAAHILSLEV